MIQTLASVCWYLVDADGDTYGDGGHLHFDSSAEAARFASDHDVDGATPRVLTDRCLFGKCTVCGDQPDWEDFNSLHFASLTEAQQAFRAHEFWVSGIEVRCPDCSPAPFEGREDVWEPIDGQEELFPAEAADA